MVEGALQSASASTMALRLMGILWDTMEDQPVIVSGTGDVPFPLRHYWSVLYTRFQPYQMWYGAK